ncbi:MAG: (2Fe-2S)-binding protein [Aminipila sp.]
MEIKIKVNGTVIEESISADLLLIDFLRGHGYYSVKRGCDTSNCGLCSVLLDGKVVLSCSLLAAKANGKEVTTLEGLKAQAETFGTFMAEEGAEQCGYCSPGFIMTVLAMEKEFKEMNLVATEDDINKYLSGNLCRCTGYMGHIRAVTKYLTRQEAEL